MYKDTKKGYPPATEKGRQGQTSKSTPIKYQDKLICGKSQLLMKLHFFLSTNDGTIFIFVPEKSNDIKSQA